MKTQNKVKFILSKSDSVVCSLRVNADFIEVQDNIEWKCNLKMKKSLQQKKGKFPELKV
ncbi:hypothetical protein [Chryseobacterium sediminis]|uniref:Uncharacterized protein n=1 Tax=Chryseobacterium sediminis TaxID=1679494 RepID=A0ABR6Q1F6_9FLAO|nr:hypothetical protein [Chryseobacterium sediminis]MBB6331531.1 hypothetical protein [Chryseobacterium sediminis]